MLVAISGSQGSGKSTIIKELSEQGYNTINRKTSRSILTDWGVTLQQVNNDPSLTTKFQEEITSRKYHDEYEAIHSDELWFTERTHGDLFAYALVSLGKDNEYSEWLDGYYNTCMRYNQWYSAVYYLRAGFFNVEHDGTRGSSHFYSRMVDLVMLDITQQMVHNSKLTIVDTPQLKCRVDLIKTQQSYQNLSDNEGVTDGG